MGLGIKSYIIIKRQMRLSRLFLQSVYSTISKIMQSYLP